MNLAKTRILQVLPQRLQEWALSPSLAEDKNIKGKRLRAQLHHLTCALLYPALDQVRKQQLDVRHILQELDKRHREIDYLVSRAKNVMIDPQWENDVSSEIFVCSKTT